MDSKNSVANVMQQQHAMHVNALGECIVNKKIIKIFICVYVATDTEIDTQVTMKKVL